MEMLGGMFRRRLFWMLIALVWLCIFTAPGSQAQDPSIFLNIDCGSAVSFQHQYTNLTWESDERYIGTGVSVFNGQDYSENRQYSTLRYFNDTRAKNCYHLPVKHSFTYMLRTEFMPGDYMSASTDFMVSVDTMIVFNVSISASEERISGYYYEATYVAKGNTTFLCLLRGSSKDNPYINTITLRQVTPYPMLHTDYLAKGRYAVTAGRYNFGGDDLRYPFDIYDRFWTALDVSTSSNLMSTSPLKHIVNKAKNFIYAGGNADYQHVPQGVLQTGLTTDGNMTLRLYFRWGHTGFLLLHFAELDPSANVSSRSFYVAPQHSEFSEPSLVNPMNNSLPDGDATGFVWRNLQMNGSSEMVDFVRIPTSALGPIVNGAEMFDISPQPALLKTVELDAIAIDGIKSSLKFGALWTGDPCLPVPHAGLTCNTLNPPQIVGVDLSKSQLAGNIPPAFNGLTNLTTLVLSGNNFEGPLPDLSSLKTLQILHLQNNNLTGKLPGWLADLPFLNELYVQNNNFEGNIPPGLVNRTGLNFAYTPGNPSLVYDPNAKPDPKTNIWIIVGPVVGGVAALALIIGIIVCCCIRRKRQLQSGNVEGGIPPKGSLERTPNAGGSVERVANAGGPIDRVPNPGARKFSIATITTATGNFKQEIGRGGFGPVYYGKLPNGEQVAIKVLDKTSNQGASEFFNEVDLLSRVHHKNLVALIGYCNEGDSRMLVYEYLPEGSLRDRLNGDLKNKGPFEWKTRLNVAVNAAQGLEYLHTGLSQNIIHRDVKSTNILLTSSKDAAKVCDFGLSRLTPGENGSLTFVKGTRGYIDPEYVSTQLLTTKSDVYSFGMVLLELLTGRLPLESTSPQPDYTWSLCDWVRNNLHGGDIDKILDPAVNACHPNKDAVWKVAELALMSMEPRSIHRPTMPEVVLELKAALSLEEAWHSAFDSAASRSGPFQQQLVQQHDYSGGFSSGDTSWPAPR